MNPSTALTVGEGRCENTTVFLADGSVFDFGRPGTIRFKIRRRKFIRMRLKNEPEFRAEFGDQYTRRGKYRG
jgi:hypothetical protein